MREYCAKSELHRRSGFVMLKGRPNVSRCVAGCVSASQARRAPQKDTGGLSRKNENDDSLFG